MWTVDQYIAALGGAAALATALATFLTVREMARQRKATLKPDLISVHQDAYVYVEQPVSTLRYLWTNERPTAPSTLQHSSYGIAVLNVGVGAAKQVRSEWTIDVEAMAIRINALARDASVPVSVELVPGEGEIRILWPDRVVSTQLVANQLTYDGGYLLPISLDRAGLRVEIPSVLLTLASLQIALGLANRYEVAHIMEWANPPDAVLSLRYMDVDGESHVKRMILTLQLLSAGHEGVSHHSGQLPTFMQFSVRVNEA